MATKCELEAKRILEYLNSDEMKMLFEKEITWTMNPGTYRRDVYYIYAKSDDNHIGMPSVYAMKVFDFAKLHRFNAIIEYVNKYKNNEIFSIQCFTIS